MKKIKFLYIVISILVFIILLSVVVVFIKSNNKKDVTENNRNAITNIIDTKSSNENKDENKIIINKLDSTKKSLSVNAKWEDADLIEEFDFLNRIYIPQNLNQIRQGKVYVKANIEDEDYKEFRQYSIIYTDKSEEEIKNIEFVFSNKKLLADCIPVGLENAEESTIDGIELKIYANERINEPTLISGEAYFEYNDNNYDIKCYRLTQEEFIKIVSSIIQEIKK